MEWPYLGHYVQSILVIIDPLGLRPLPPVGGEKLYDFEIFRHLWGRCREAAEEVLHPKQNYIKKTSLIWIL